MKSHFSAKAANEAKMPQIRDSDVNEIMRYFRTARNSSEKVKTEKSDFVDFQRGSDIEGGSELYEDTHVPKKLVRHTSLPREIFQDDNQSIVPSIQNDLPLSQKEELNSTALESYFWNRQKKPSKFSLYKGS